MVTVRRVSISRRRARCRTGSQREALDAGFQREDRDEALAARFVRHAVVHRIEREERIAREVHLGDEALDRRVAHEREVDVRGSPRERVVLPRVGAGLHREEAVPAVVVGEGAPHAVEVRIERRVVRIHGMVVAP